MNSENIQELYRYYTVNIRFLQHNNNNINNNNNICLKSNIQTSSVDCAYHTLQQTVNSVQTIIQQQYRNRFDVIVKQCDII